MFHLFYKNIKNITCLLSFNCFFSFLTFQKKLLPPFHYPLRHSTFFKHVYFFFFHFSKMFSMFFLKKKTIKTNLFLLFDSDHFFTFMMFDDLLFTFFTVCTFKNAFYFLLVVTLLLFTVYFSTVNLPFNFYCSTVKLCICLFYVFLLFTIVLHQNFYFAVPHLS